MLHVVSGYMRTGTSMMMKALEAGGLDAEYQQDRDVLKNRHADKHYDPNLGGLYELELSAYNTPGFPLPYDGKLIKALGRSTVDMEPCPNKMRIVYMRRDPEEIRQSFMGFFGKNELADFMVDGRFLQYVESVLKFVRNRRDVVSCTELWYRDVVDDPFTAFETLVADGWDIDTYEATKVINPELCRYKLEHLEVGIT